MLDVFFCFNYSATNEIDTYGHTRSLPDALPIYVRADGLEPPVLRRELVDPSAPVLVAEGGVTPLAVVRVLRHGPPAGRQATRVGPQPGAAAVGHRQADRAGDRRQIGRAACRERVCQYV